MPEKETVARPVITAANEAHPPLQPEQVDDFTKCLESVEEQIRDMEEQLDQGVVLEDYQLRGLDHLRSLQKYYTEMLITSDAQAGLAEYFQNGPIDTFSYSSPNSTACS